MNIPARLSSVCLMLCFGSLSAMAADEPLLPRPQDRVLDQAHALLPESIVGLNGELLRAEQDHSLHIYLLTLPYLKAPAVDRKAKLEEVANIYAANWIQGVGALILFDDESGLLTVAYSPDAKRLYTEVALDALLRPPLEASQVSGLAREKIERASKVVVKAMETLQQETVLKTPGEHPVIRFIGGFLLLIAIALVVHHSLNRPPTDAPVVDPEELRSSRRKKIDKW